MTEVQLTGLALHRPARRLPRTAIAGTWGHSATGELRVAGPDEDAVTLAVAAADAMGDPLDTVSTVVLVRPTTPAGAGDGAAVAAAALGLAPSVRTVELGGSDRAVGTAIGLAADLVRGGADRAVLVLAGDDSRMVAGSPAELRHGHGGAAVLVGRDPGPARLVTTASVNAAVADRWFGPDGARRDAGERFLATTVLPPLLDVLPGPGGEGVPVSLQVAVADARAAARLAAARGHAADRVAAGSWDAGAPGLVLPAALLAEAVAAAAPGELIEVVAVGSGLASVTVEVTDPARVVRDLAPPGPEVAYATYLRAGGQLEPPLSAPATSPVTAWRDLDATLRLHGGRCERCRTTSYPQRPACPSCGSTAPMVSERLVGTATVVTTTTDHLVAGVNPGTPESPTTMVVGETPQGARLFLPAVHGTEPAIGSEVRTVLRLAHLGGGFRSYHWRFAPTAP